MLQNTSALKGRNEYEKLTSKTEGRIHHCQHRSSSTGVCSYIGIQYVPQVIESSSVDSILMTMRDDQKTDRITSVGDARTKLAKLLQINEMNDMVDTFTVRNPDGKVTIEFKYDRDPNLVYKRHPMRYEKTLTLR